MEPHLQSDVRARLEKEPDFTDQVREDALKEARSSRTKTHKAVKDKLKEIAAALPQHADERAD